MRYITLHIDEQPVQVPEGINVIEAAALAGKEIPHYCYHPKLSVVGNCRMCLIEMGMPLKDRATGAVVLDEKGAPRINWAPKPVIGCGTQAASGMHIKTQSPLIEDCRKGVMEFLLLNHPLDCPICDQAGECSLQEFATDYGRGYSRFIESKNVKPKRTRLGPRIILDDERCILCSRCIRFCQEIVDDDVLGFIDRGSYTTLTFFPGRQLENNYSLNTVDICPVGALTSSDSRFKMRVWFLKPSKSICTESSVGTNTWVYSREDKIYRITPRRNDAVNDTWMSDSGRQRYQAVEADMRLKTFRVDGVAVPAEKAFEIAGGYLKQSAGEIAYVDNGHSSVEEQFLLKKLVQACPGPVHFVAHLEAGDALLISTDRTPNVRGALAVELIQTLPRVDLSALASQIEEGQVQTLVVFNEELLMAGLAREHLDQVTLLYIGTHENETSQQAKVVLPGLTVFEKSGTFVNQQFRVQKFEPAISGPPGLFPDSDLLLQLLACVQETTFTSLSVTAIWDQIVAQIPLLTKVHYDTLPDEGQCVSGSAFSDLPFCEGKTLHYKNGATAAS